MDFCCWSINSVGQRLGFEASTALQQFRLDSYKKLCLSELLGTYLLVFLGPASVVLALSSNLTAFEAQELIAAVFGCTVAGLIIGLGRHSGAHINPAVTVASTAAGRLELDHFLPYLLSQITGAILAGLSLKLVFERTSPATSLGSTKLASGVSALQGVCLETVGTFVLAMSALAAGSFLKAHLHQGIFVGITLFILITLIGPLTGASLNPVRSLGPSIFSGYFNDQLIYYIGPIVGGLSAGLIFGMLTKTVRRPET